MSVAAAAHEALDFAQSANELHAICERIEMEFGPSEAAFLHVGSALQTLCLEVEGLAASASSAAEEATSSLQRSALPEISRASKALLH